MDRLGLELGLGSEPHVVVRLGSGLRVGARGEVPPGCIFGRKVVSGGVVSRELSPRITLEGLTAKARKVFSAVQLYLPILDVDLQAVGDGGQRHQHAPANSQKIYI